MYKYLLDHPSSPYGIVTVTVTQEPIFYHRDIGSWVTQNHFDIYRHRKEDFVQYFDVTECFLSGLVTHQIRHDIKILNL